MAVANPMPLSFDGFTLDPSARTLVRADGEPIPLRRSEFELLLAFVNNPGRALSRDYLLELVAGRHSEAFDRSIDVLVGRLRRKIEREPKQPGLILTVPGIGYRFSAKPSSIVLPAEKKHTAGSTSAPCAPRLSIVVLPFANLSDDREQQYFADGITDDLTTDLSRLEHMFVISRNTAFTYQNRRVDTKQIGRELGVRYVLEGSVRRLGNQVRVNTQLIDAESNAHLWAGRFDRKSLDLFDLQNEVTSRIAIALNLELIAAEATRPTDHPDVLEYILRGRAVRLSPVTRANHTEAIGWFERALVLDPRSVKAQSSLAVSLVGRVLDGMTDTPAADIQRAEELARKVIAVSPRDARAHFARGQVHRVMGRYDEAIREYEMVLELNRNWMRVIGDLGWCKFLIGSIEEAISLHEQAIRLSPRDPGIGNWYDRIGRIHLLQSRIDEAIVWLEKARSANPEHPNVHVDLAAAYALKGETDRAATELAEARRLSSDGRYSSITRLKAAAHWGVPKIHALYEATYFVGLRKAGMPEQ
jgi:TolB-like protein/Flp pilus assembly protein TadD